MSVTVLLSGGVDSAACLAYFKNRGDRLTAVFIDYGQSPADRERASARSLARWCDVPLLELRCCGPAQLAAGEIPARNAFLVFTTILLTGQTSGLVTMGIHSGTGYYDCSTHFVTSMNAILDGYSNGQLTLSVPFLDWDKKMVWTFAEQQGVPTDMTWSCEVGPDQSCGGCRSCLDVEALRAST